MHPSRDELIRIIAGLDAQKPIVVTGHSMGAALTALVAADIYSILEQNKLDLTLIMFAAFKSADQEFCWQLHMSGTWIPRLIMSKMIQ